MVVRRSRKREPEINLSELIWALEDDVIDRRRAKSEPPIRGILVLKLLKFVHQ